MRPTLALLTSGGDAPGMNMALHVLTERAEQKGWRVLGVRAGLAGLLRGELVPLAAQDTLPYTRRGGTLLGTSRVASFDTHVAAAQGVLERYGVTHLAVIGGNGSLRACASLAESLPVVGLPGTIDNDVSGSELSIGFDTALNTGLALLDQIRDSCESLPRLFALETLGGDTGFLAQAVAAAGCADLALLPEDPQPEEAIAARLRGALRARGYAVVVGSEGYPDLIEVLGRVADALDTRIRISRVGHAQRGGAPTAADRLLASRLAHAALGALAGGSSGVALWRRGRAAFVPFADTVGTKPLSFQREGA